MKPRYLPASPHNDHLDKLSAYFGPIEPRAASLPADTEYVFMCFTNRCGSNYLAGLLASNGRYNSANENLNADTVLYHSKLQGIDSFQDYFAWLAGAQRRAGHVFLKAAAPQIELLGRAGILAQIAGHSKFVLVERSDKLGQAISHLLAFATGRFSSRIQDGTDPAQVKFSRRHIDYVIDEICEYYRQFNLFFARNGIVPVQVNYENLVADPKGQIALIGQQLGLMGLSIVPGNLRLERQAGPVNELWRRVYLEGVEDGRESTSFCEQKEAKKL